MIFSAVKLPCASYLISSGSSFIKENPLRESSICHDEYPRSSNTPCTGVKLSFGLGSIYCKTSLVRTGTCIEIILIVLITLNYETHLENEFRGLFPKFIDQIREKYLRRV